MRRKFKRPGSCKCKFFVCMYVCGHCHSTCSLWLAVVAMLRKFETWFADVNAPTQPLVLVDVEAQGSGGDDDEEVLSDEGENEAREENQIDDEDEVVEMTQQGTVTLV